MSKKDMRTLTSTVGGPLGTLTVSIEVDIEAYGEDWMELGEVTDMLRTQGVRYFQPRNVPWCADPECEIEDQHRTTEHPPPLFLPCSLAEV